MSREQGMGCCRADTGCLEGLPGMRTSRLPGVGVTVMLVTEVTSTHGTMCDYGQAQALPLLLLLLCFLVKTPVLREFVEISCSGFGRGGKLTGQQTHVGNVDCARQARCHLRTHRVHWTALKHSIEGDKEKQMGNWRWNSQCLSTANSVPCADLREGATTGF